MTEFGCYVSDLHMFSRRSQAERYADAIPQAIKQARMFVLGGDIFDFRWTTLAGVAETVDRGVAWLVALIEQNPHCEVHYVLGNHDDNQLLMDHLERLAARYDHFTWERFYLRIDDKLFLHGDVADRTMDHAALVERRNSDVHQTRPPSSHLAYDVAIRARLHMVPSFVWHSPERVTKRIMSYLETIGQSPDGSLRHVYFGHTHRAMLNYPCGDLLFHNGGAPIRGLPFEILQFAL